MSERKNGLSVVAASKPKHKFKNKAEAIGFARLVENYANCKQALEQGGMLLAEVVESLDIEGYDINKVYQINLDTLELVEQAG